MEKKPYAPPAVTQHGKAVEQTKGLGGKYLETLMPKVISDYDVEKWP
jgi:hypothetical protein